MSIDLPEDRWSVTSGLHTHPRRESFDYTPCSFWYSRTYDIPTRHMRWIGL